MGAMASQITILTIVFQPFIQAQIKENIKGPRHWPLWGEFSAAQMATNAENVSIWWSNHELLYVVGSVEFHWNSFSWSNWQ